MADLPEIKLDFGESFPNALASMNQARYYGAHANALQASEQRKQDAQASLAPAMAGNPQAMGRLAYGDPQAAVAVSTALSRMDAATRARTKEQADYNAQSANAILQADPAERPAIYKQMYDEGVRRNYDMSHLPSSYSPQIDPFLRFTRAAAVPIQEWFKTQMDMPQPMGGASPAGGGAVSGGTITPSTLHGAIVGQESGGQQTDKNGQTLTSVNGAQGIGQMIPSTFQQYALPGEKIDNKADNLRASGRAIDDYYRKYKGDPARVAVAYFSGEGNVAPPGSPTPWINDAADGNGKTVSSYVGDVLKRAGAASPPGQAAGPAMAGTTPVTQGDANGPPVQLGAPPAASPATAPPGAPPGALPPGVQVAGPPQAAPAPAPAAAPPVRPFDDVLSHVPQGWQALGTQKHGPAYDSQGRLRIINRATGQETVIDVPKKDVNAFEDIKDANGNIVGQRNKITNQYHPIQPTPGAANVDPSLKGDDVYAALPPARAAEIRSIVEGDNPIPPPTSRAPYAQETRALVFQAAGPGFTDALHAQRMQTKKDMASTKPGTTGGRLISQGTLFNHMDHALDVADELNNSPYPLANKALNAIGVGAGDPRVTELEVTKEKINAELDKYFAGHTTVSGLQQARNELNAAQSPAQIKASIRTLTTLVGGQQSELVNGINRGLGYIGKPQALKPDDPLIISPEGAKSRADVIARTKANPTDNSKLMDTGKQFLGAAPPAASPQAAPAPKPGNYRWTPQGMVPQ